MANYSGNRGALKSDTYPPELRAGARMTRSVHLSAHLPNHLPVVEETEGTPTRYGVPPRNHRFYGSQYKPSQEAGNGRKGPNAFEQMLGDFEILSDSRETYPRMIQSYRQRL